MIQSHLQSAFGLPANFELYQKQGRPIDAGRFIVQAVIGESRQPDGREHVTTMKIS
ncbi:MAG: hypothetical protein AB9903_24050 [Vulcanimicrobiota bacterium]